MRVSISKSVLQMLESGHKHWLSSQKQDALECFPADELYSQTNRLESTSWMLRWNNARAQLGKKTSATLARSETGPFVALKNDPIWCAISRWNLPFPPFEENSEMWVRDASDADAERLGFFNLSVPAPSSNRYQLNICNPQ